MATDLIITFDGATEALREHRLSLADFGPALMYLRAALQRAARDAAEKGARGSVDLELSAVEKGSTKPTLRIVYRQDGQSAFVFTLEEIAAIATTRVVRDITAESRGEACNVRVRKLLRSIPPGVTVQRYAVVRDGVQIESAEVHVVTLVRPTRAMPTLRSVECVVVGVAFAPAPTTVEIDVAGRLLTCDATPDMVERALAMRNQRVYATVLGWESRRRLLTLRDRPYVPPPEAERTKAIFTRWADLLERLAA